MKQCVNCPLSTHFTGNLLDPPTSVGDPQMWKLVGPRGKSYTIWVATASGGVWKSINEGVTFEPVFEHQGTSTIGDLAIAPSNPDIVWVGTGEANIFRSSNPGCGIWKTTDGGMTWEHMGLEETFTISRILVHPR